MNRVKHRKTDDVMCLCMYRAVTLVFHLVQANRKIDCTVSFHRLYYVFFANILPFLFSLISSRYAQNLSPANLLFLVEPLSCVSAIQLNNTSPHRTTYTIRNVSHFSI